MARLVLGYEVLKSYKRLSYTPWHALAEFVDNSTQAYLDNQEELDAMYAEAGSKLYVDLYYDPNAGLVRIEDNAVGMDADDLDRALQVGMPPENPTGRSRYGMGMKTAACWIGDHWTVRTSRLGVPVEYTLTVDVERVVEGNPDLPLTEAAAEADDHYTVIEITRLHRVFRGRTLSKIKDFLASMYRKDLQEGLMTLAWQGEPLRWEDVGDRFLLDPQGQPYKRTLTFDVDGKNVSGWAGVLAKGSRSQAGFSLLHSGRVVKGWPESYRPQEIFGQIEGSNDLINQRILGELNLDAFDVTHTKDDILFGHGEEETLQRELRARIENLLFVAKTTRVRRKSGPSRASAKKVASDVQSRIDDAPNEPPPIGGIPATGVTADEGARIAERYVASRADVNGNLFGQRMRAYLTDEEPPEALFLAVPEEQTGDALVLIANLRHPFLRETTSTEALSLYIRSIMVDVLPYALEEEWTELSRWIRRRDDLMRAWQSNGASSSG